jgi:hypothetical protein
MSQLDISMMFIIFRGFEKYRVSVQNTKGLAFNFTGKHLFTVKIGQKSTFHPREAYILSQLDILVLYINF